MTEARRRPPAWRIVLAFAVAPSVAALSYACLIPLYAGLPDLADRVWRTFLLYLLFGAYPSALLLGIPAFFILKNYLDPKPLNCALVGAGIASIPWLLIGLRSSPHYAYSNGHVTHDNGMITIWGLLDLATFVALIAALGFLAGLVFWAVAAAGTRTTRSELAAR